MTKEINKQEQAKYQGRFRTNLTVGMVMLIGLITLNGCGNSSTDKIYKVDELAAAALADEDAWKGKEVAVTGYVSETSGSSSRLVVTMNIDRETQKTGVTCSLQGVKADDVFGKTINVKGKIASSSADGEDKKVNLEPCELKK